MFKIEVGIMNGSAYITNDKFNWTLSIRKQDDSQVGEIAKEHKNSLEAKYLRDYLPEWENVEWRKVNKSNLFLSEFISECGEYRLNIILPENTQKTKDEVTEEFLEFMKL